MYETFDIKKRTTLAPSSSKKKMKNLSNLNAHQLMEEIKKKPIKQISKFCKKTADGQEKKLLHAYFNQQKLNDYTPTKNGIDFLMFIYQILPQSIRKNFYLYVKNRVHDTALEKRLIKNHPSNFYHSRLNKIIQIMQKDSSQNGVTV